MPSAATAMTEPSDTIVYPTEQQVENMLRDAVRSAWSAGSSGGRNSGGVDVRVAAVETHVDILRKDVTEVKAGLNQVRLQLATVTERIAHLPSEGYTVTVALAVMAVVAAFTTFQQQIQHFVHLAP